MYIIVALLSALALIAPAKMFIVVTGIFVFFDTAFAIAGTVKVNGIKSFCSHKFVNIIIKTIIYFIAIIMAYLISIVIFDGVLFGVKLLLPKIVTMLCIYTEIKSIDETSMKYFKNKSLWTILSEMMSKGKKIKKDITDIIDDDDENLEPIN